MKTIKTKDAFRSAIQLLFITFLMHSSISFSQTEFFNSKIKFSESQLKKFYSSCSVDSAQVYFNANEYYVHA